MSPKPYSGRLAYDPETDFHVDPDGKPVVTPDGGKTWQYADAGDASHFDRYHERYAGVDTTANQLAELQLEHGREKAEAMFAEQQPHHFEVQPDDPHFDRPKVDPDHVAETITGHTAAYAKDGK